MGKFSGISWCGPTFNMINGCFPVSPACLHCYAAALDKRFTNGEHWQKNGPRQEMSDSYWEAPHAWNRLCEHRQEMVPVFGGSLCDPFEDHPTVNKVRPRYFELIRATPWLFWILLTKRIENAADMLPSDYFEDGGWPNLGLAVTAENQERANERVSTMLAIPAPFYMISMEPQLGAIDLTKLENRAGLGDGEQWLNCLSGMTYGVVSGSRGRVGSVSLAVPEDYGAEPDGRGRRVHQVIFGGENTDNGKSRPYNVEWVRDGIAACRKAGVVAHFKQFGNWLPESHYTANMGRIQKEHVWPDGSKSFYLETRATGHIIDGEILHDVATPLHPGDMAQTPEQAAPVNWSAEDLKNSEELWRTNRKLKPSPVILTLPLTD